MKGWDKTDAGCRHDVRPSREILRSSLCPPLFWKLSCSTSDFFFLRSKVFTTRRDEIAMGRQCASVAHLTILRTFQHIGCYPRLLEARVLSTAAGCQSQPLNSSEWGKARHRKWEQREVSLGRVRGMEEWALTKREAKWGRRDVGKTQQEEEPLVWPEYWRIPVYPSILPTHRGDTIFDREFFSLPNTLGFPFLFLLILFIFFPPLWLAHGLQLSLRIWLNFAGDPLDLEHNTKRVLKRIWYEGTTERDVGME